MHTRKVEIEISEGGYGAYEIRLPVGLDYEFVVVADGRFVLMNTMLRNTEKFGQLALRLDVVKRQY